MRYRVSIDIPRLEWDVDVESREDAIKEAMTYLKDTMGHVFLDNLGLDSEEIITVEPIDETEEGKKINPYKGGGQNGNSSSSTLARSIQSSSREVLSRPT